MNQFRHASARDVRHRLDPAGTRRRALLAIPALGVLVLVLLWTVIFARLSVEKETTYREAMASAAILSAALEQHTVKAIHQVDQITRFVKFEFEKTPGHFDLGSTVEKGVVQSETLVQVSLIDEHGKLIANTADPNPNRSTCRTANTSRCTSTRTMTSCSSASPCSAASRAIGPCR